MTRRVVPLPPKPYRPRRPERLALLVQLTREGKKLHEIASAYGGTPAGVRSNLRRLRERGAL
jgi:hypothetical protein